MKKKLLLAALGVAAAAALSLGVAACGSGSESGDWTVEKVYAKAQSCGYRGTVKDLEAELEAHAINDLGAVEAEADHEHVFPEWTKILVPACNRIGISFRQCTLCRDAEFSFEEALPHTFGAARIVVEATCEKEGLSLSTCTGCGFVKEDVIPLGAHTFEEGWTSDANFHWHKATCSHSSEISGKEAHTFEGGVCTECGKASSAYLLPVEYTGIAMYFGENITPWEYLHNGVDFVAEAGAPVYATATGTVTVCAGDMVVISHAGNVESWYRCVDIDPSIKVGDTVKQGDKIGAVAEGNYEGTEPHLCFELHFDRHPVDPLPYLGIESDRHYPYE